MLDIRNRLAGYKTDSREMLCFLLGQSTKGRNIMFVVCAKERQNGLCTLCHVQRVHNSLLHFFSLFNIHNSMYFLICKNLLFGSLPWESHKWIYIWILRKYLKLVVILMKNSWAILDTLSDFLLNPLTVCIQKQNKILNSHLQQ